MWLQRLVQVLRERKASKPAILGIVLSLCSSSILANDGVYVQLFQWQHNDVAKECEDFLGPKGYEAVVVSPPQEHIDKSNWWAVYQPVSYQLEGRFGNSVEFSSMISRCHAAGVKVVVDAVINHMARGDGVAGVGVNGTPYDPELLNYVPYNDPQNHFHQPQCGIDWDVVESVQECNMIGLPDLNTGNSETRAILRQFLKSMLDLGVDGFRIDGAKHISQEDLGWLLLDVDDEHIVYQEVVDFGDGAVRASDYIETGQVTEFLYSTRLGDIFHTGNLAWLADFGEVWGMLPSEHALVFLDNHDSQRWEDSTVLTHKKDLLYYMGNIFMLAWPYGQPKVMSSFRFEDKEAGPPAVGVHSGAGCYSDWACEHRWRPTANMVTFRKVAADAPVVNWWDNGANQIAFERQGKGFVVINHEDEPLAQTFNTSLPPGRYCNIINDDFSNNRCSGQTTEIGSDGTLTLEIPPQQVSAFHIGAVETGPEWLRGINGLYRITARHSGKALDVAGISLNNGANLHQWDYVGGRNQQWQVEDVGGGRYKIRARHSDKLLDVSGMNTSNGSNVHQWEDVGAPSQIWYMADAGNGYVAIINEHANKALDVNAIRHENGTNIHIWQYQEGWNQQWRLTPVE
jgi:alpha-amylase